MAEFKLDLAREERIGLEEAVFCAGKTAGQIAAILESLPRGAGMFLTRLDAEKFNQLPSGLRSLVHYEPLSRTGVFGPQRLPRSTPPVAIVMAGTSDVPMGREAARTLAYAGQSAVEFTDIGVAGLWRLLDRIDEIRRAPVVIVAAGMDAALVSVVGGTGARAADSRCRHRSATASPRGGTSALHSTLASCAPGVAVVNIDNGYGAASAALRICNLLASAASDASSAAQHLAR